MKPQIDLEKCIGCGACVPVCPAEPKVLAMEETGAGPKSKAANPQNCIACNACVSACPVQAIKLVE
ncbi:MAG TPA: 4Fe-4S dicluster domain-containing protein [Candidatus Altiarchaeales archaeon]|nr:4Fe-4S dicluster domain-containing protein [Candidatus Altiarchaeales archaeon]